jgi:hypothetical protein
MKSKRLALALATSFALAAYASADDAKPQDSGTLEMKPAGRPGEVTGSRSEKLSATVKAIDHATREVSLEGPGGESESFKVGDEVRNLDQIKVGDKIVVEFLRGLMLQIQAPGEAPVTPSAEVVEGRAAVGAKPGAAVGATIQATVTLTAIDLQNRIVVFRGPSGNLYQVKAAPEVKLENAKVGQQFVATYTEAVVVEVEPAEKAAK